MRFGFLYSEYSLSAGLCVLRKLLKHGGLKQEDYGKALKSLTVVTEWEPRP